MRSRRAAPTSVMILMAQAVPTATAVPCIAALPAGWSVGGVRVRRGDGRFWLDSDQAGGHAVEVRLRPPGACAVDDATEVPSDEPGWRRFEQPEQLPPALRAVRTYVSDGACVTYALRVRRRRQRVGDASPSTPRSAFQPRAELVDEVERPLRARAVRRRRPAVHRGRRMSAVLVASAPRRRRAHRASASSSPSSSRACRCACSACAGGGARRCSPACSAGASRSSSPSA